MFVYEAINLFPTEIIFKISDKELEIPIIGNEKLYKVNLIINNEIWDLKSF